MVGSSALLTFGLWASKISHLNQDPSSYGTYAITMVQGKNNKKVSFISAYIAVQKGSNIGVDSLYAQQVMVYECKCHQSNILPSHSFCPHSDAIKWLDELIHSLQQQNHAIILMLDAHQSSQESTVKPFSIEWLWLPCGMEDPFITLTGHCLNSTTQTPNWDIDFILSYGIQNTNTSTLPVNTLAISDHPGILFDINLEAHLSSKNSDITNSIPRLLTSGNKSSADPYLSYIDEQLDTQKNMGMHPDLISTPHPSNQKFVTAYIMNM